MPMASSVLSATRAESQRSVRRVSISQPTPKTTDPIGAAADGSNGIVRHRRDTSVDVPNSPCAVSTTVLGARYVSDPGRPGMDAGIVGEHAGFIRRPFRARRPGVVPRSVRPRGVDDSPLCDDSTCRWSTGLGIGYAPHLGVAQQTANVPVGGLSWLGRVLSATSRLRVRRETTTRVMSSIVQ